MTNGPLVDLGDLTKPATALVEKISEAVGGIFRPHQIVRVARAEAEAGLIRAEADIAVTDLHRRALRRFLDEEARSQGNIESIASMAIPLLDADSTPSEMSSDWIANFFDKSRIVSDEAMQELWARVLAGEANRPGAFSRRTVNLIGDLDQYDAQLFSTLCGFAWKISGASVPIISDLDANPYEKHDIHFSSLSHLESLSLIRFDNKGGFKIYGLPSTVTVTYFDNPLELSLPAHSEGTLHIGRVFLTIAGQELATVCNATPVDGFYEHVRSIWASRSLCPPFPDPIPS